MMSGTRSRLVRTPFEPAEQDAGDERQSHGNPGIDVMEFDQQRGKTAGDREDAADRQVDLHHRHEVNHPERDDADQRRLAQDGLDRSETEKFRIRDADGKQHCNKDNDKPAVFEPAPAHQTGVALDCGSIRIAEGIRSTHDGIMPVQLLRRAWRPFCPHIKVTSLRRRVWHFQTRQPQRPASRDPTGRSGSDCPRTTGSSASAC